MKIVIGINSLVSTVHAAYGNHIQMFFNLGRQYRDIDFILNNPARMSIDKMRNMTAEIALYSESDFLLFLDDDVLVPMNDEHQWLRKMINADADIVAADVMIRSYPFDHMIFKYSKETPDQLLSLAELPSIDKPFLADAVGFSCCLIKTTVLKKIPKPYFVTTPGHSTEDIYFCLKAKDNIPDIKIMCEPTITCGHVLWEEVISSMNKENYKRYYDNQYTPVELQPLVKDRGQEYYQMVVENLDLKKEKTNAIDN